MTEYLLAVCSSGHLIDADEYDYVAVDQLGVSEAVSAEKVANPEYSVGSNYCQDCGGEVLTQCRSCGYNIKIEYYGPSNPDPEEIPDFCEGCGESYPWTDTVEAEQQRDGEFIKIDETEIDGHFYPGLIYEINLCYQVQAEQAVLVLNRKLIESLIVDILRTVFSMDRLNLFYDENNHQTHALGTLVANMKDNKSELKKYVSLDEDFFRAVENLKYHGDASAHAIEENPLNEDISKKSKEATAVAKILFRLRNEAKTSYRN